MYASPLRSISAQCPGGLSKLGRDCTPFGLSLTVKERAEIRAITLTPISPNRLLDVRPLSSIFSLFLLYDYFF